MSHEVPKYLDKAAARFPKMVLVRSVGPHVTQQEIDGYEIDFDGERPVLVYKPEKAWVFYHSTYGKSAAAVAKDLTRAVELLYNIS